MRLFDSHCHLTDPAFAGDVDAVLTRAREAGLTGMVCIASDPADARAASALAAQHDDVWCTAGLHPHAAGSAAGGYLEELRERLDAPRVVAVGEAGLDYHYDNAPRPVQREVFARQLELAAELGLPVVVHSRDADDDTASMLREAGPAVRGVLHCFTGNRQLLETALATGWYVSFSGLITFRNFSGQDVLRAVPEDRLLLETDSPYLAPVPQRGRRNEPAFVAHTCGVAAAMRSVEPELLAHATERNARAFYDLPPAP